MKPEEAIKVLTGRDVPIVEWTPGLEIPADHTFLFRHPDTPDTIARGDGLLELPCGCRYVEGIRLDSGEPALYMSSCDRHVDEMARVLERFKALPPGGEVEIELWRRLWEEETGG